jgi:beta-N-acetylhexosaminidase
VLSIEAGNDLVLIKEDEQTTAECFHALLDAVQSGRIREARLEESVRRILRVKAQFGILDDPMPDPARADRIVLKPRHREVCRETYRRAALVLRDRQGLLPLSPQRRVLVVEPYIPLYHMKGNDRWYHPGMFGEFMRAHSPNTVYLETQTPPDAADLQRFQERVAGVDTVVFFNVFWRGSTSNRALIRETVRLGKRVIVATNDLYDGYFLPTAGTVLCTFGAVPEGLRIAADILYGREQPAGRWPLKRLAPEDMVPEGEVVDHATSGHFAKL